MPASAATTGREAIIAGADRLVQLQADITEDNAGNSDPDADPDNGGWDWVLSTSATEHTGGTSYGNLYGCCAEGIMCAGILDPTNTAYATALEDVYTETKAEYDSWVSSGKADPIGPRIRSAPSVIQLAEYTALTGDSKYATLAEHLYQSQTNYRYSSATALAEGIRDVRLSQGWDGLVAWDISLWVGAAEMLGHHAYAVAMAEVIYQDSYVEGDPKFDPTDSNEPAYDLGLAGIIAAFKVAGVHSTEMDSAYTTLKARQSGDGSWNSDPQDTAYAVIAMDIYGGVEADNIAQDGAWWLIFNQDADDGGWSYSSSEYPEIDGEATSAIYNALTSTLGPDDPDYTNS